LDEPAGWKNSLKKTCNQTIVQVDFKVILVEKIN